ncbi:hypothetical protein D3C81_607770 [compost metagenome]
MGHVDEQVGTDLVGDLTEAWEIEGFRVGREPGDDHLRFALHRQALDFVVIDQARLGVDAVLHGVVQLARGRHLGAVGQVPAVGQAHAQNGVAGLQQGQVHGAVGRGAGVWLDVGVIGAEQLLGAVDGQLLDFIHMLATAVVALARVAFGVFVGQAAALGLHDALAGVVLRGDQLDVIFLALFFGIHRRQQCIVVTLDLVLLAEHRVSPGSGIGSCRAIALLQRWYDRRRQPRCLWTPHKGAFTTCDLIAGQARPHRVVQILWERACPAMRYRPIQLYRRLHKSCLQCSPASFTGQCHDR